MNEFLRNSPLKYVIPGILLIGLLWLSYSILHDFFASIFWAIIIAYVMWPSYSWLRGKLNNANLSALVFTGLISVLLGLTLYWVLAMMQRELKLIYPLMLNNLAHPNIRLPDEVKNIPWLNNLLQHYLDQINANDAGLKAQLLDWLKQWLREFGNFIGSLGKHIIELGFSLVTLFFCFRDGEKIISQLHQGLAYFLGKYQNIYLKTAGDTARAVVYGLVLAALSQGIIAGIGYNLMGVNAPVLLGAMTALLAMVPFGSTLIWLPVSLGLILANDIWHGVGLILWGIFLISTVDNVIRPLIISGASQIPFLVVMFGVFGGLSTFGGVGLFLGPVILSVSLAVWHAWLRLQINNS